MVACVHQFGDGNAGHRRVARQRNHGVAVAAEHEGGDVLDGDVQLLAMKVRKRAESRMPAMPMTRLREKPLSL